MSGKQSKALRWLRKALRWTASLLHQTPEHGEAMLQRYRLPWPLKPRVRYHPSHSPVFSSSLPLASAHTCMQNTH